MRKDGYHLPNWAINVFTGLTVTALALASFALGNGSLGATTMILGGIAWLTFGVAVLAIFTGDDDEEWIILELDGDADGTLRSDPVGSQGVVQDHSQRGRTP